MKWRADAPLAESASVAFLALALALAGLSGAVLGALGPAPWARAALAAAALALLALAISLNGLLRLQGLGGEGMGAAAGVLGGALVLLARALAALGGGPRADEPLFDWLELAGFALTAAWLARCGWALRHLVAPPGLTGTGSLVAAGAAAALAEVAFLRSLETGAGPFLRALPFLPLAVWALGVAGLGTFGRVPAAEPPE